MEYLPVAVDILVAKGCDGMVFALAEKMLAAGLIADVGTGSSLYGDGDILFRAR